MTKRGVIPTRGWTAGTAAAEGSLRRSMSSDPRGLYWIPRWSFLDELDRDSSSAGPHRNDDRRGIPAAIEKLRSSRVECDPPVANPGHRCPRSDELARDSSSAGPHRNDDRRRDPCRVLSSRACRGIPAKPGQSGSPVAIPGPRCRRSDEGLRDSSSGCACLGVTTGGGAANHRRPRPTLSSSQPQAGAQRQAQNQPPASGLPVSARLADRFCDVEYNRTAPLFPTE